MRRRKRELEKLLATRFRVRVNDEERQLVMLCTLGDLALLSRWAGRKPDEPDGWHDLLGPQFWWIEGRHLVIEVAGPGSWLVAGCSHPGGLGVRRA